MMQPQMNKEKAIQNIFGPYIYKIRTIPGCELKKSDKEKEKRLFQMIDDYIEQA